VIGFLVKNGLDKDFKLNIETNHAQLAGFPVFHELTVAMEHGMVGGVDVNEAPAETAGTPTASLAIR